MELWRIPPETLSWYEKAVVEAARFERLQDGSWYAKIPGFTGVWASCEKTAWAEGKVQEKTTGS
jgi:hypothetical protein